MGLYVLQKIGTAVHQLNRPSSYGNKKRRSLHRCQTTLSGRCYNYILCSRSSKRYKKPILKSTQEKANRVLHFENPSIAPETVPTSGILLFMLSKLHKHINTFIARYTSLNEVISCLYSYIETSTGPTKRALYMNIRNIYYGEERRKSSNST